MSSYDSLRNNKQYKAKYVCPTCHKVFKRINLSDIDETKELYAEDKPAKCPDCGKLAWFVDSRFRAPRIEDKLAWERLEILLKLGILDFWGPGMHHNIPKGKKAIKKTIMEDKRGWVIYIKQIINRKNENKNIPPKSTEEVELIVNKVLKQL